MSRFKVVYDLGFHLDHHSVTIKATPNPIGIHQFMRNNGLEHITSLKM